MATIKIALEPVVSSNLQAVGFDAERQRVAVQFKNGKIYYYAGVSLEAQEQFAKAESLGGFYSRHIRGRYVGELMTGECPKCGDAPGFAGETCADCGCDVYTVPPKKEAANE